MSKRLLYLFGDPGTGKITVARILQRQLGWKLFWLHDLDAVCQIVGRYPLPRLMDKISLAVLEELMNESRDIIYVRPSRDSETREGVKALAATKGYAVYSIRLWASYDTLVSRVQRRGPSPFLRVSSKADLDYYLGCRPATSLTTSGECLLNTEEKTPEQVADSIQELINNKPLLPNLDSIPLVKAYATWMHAPEYASPVGNPDSDEMEDMDTD